MADSWPISLDDSKAREEWGWEPEYSIQDLAEDMYLNLSKKLS